MSLTLPRPLPSASSGTLSDILSATMPGTVPDPRGVQDEDVADRPRNHDQPDRNRRQDGKGRKNRRGRRIAMASFIFFAMVFAGYPNSLVGSAVWWSMDSGPLARTPRDVLTETSPLGAVRVYGDNLSQDAATSARQSVDALAFAGGFRRAVVAIMIPTGSGWVDPKEVDALEEFTGGDIASVSARYSTAPSVAVMLMHRDLAEKSAEALISEVVHRVDALPAKERPRIVVHGQSLGASVGVDLLQEEPQLNSAISARLWQGLPGGMERPAPIDRCTVSAMNPDDPVGKISSSLLAHPLTALSVLKNLPGSENKAPGSMHAYHPVLPPMGCI